MADAVASPPLGGQRPRHRCCAGLSTAGCSACVVALALLLSATKPVDDAVALAGLRRLERRAAHGLADASSKGVHKGTQQKRDKHKAAGNEPKRDGADKRNGEMALPPDQVGSGPPATEGALPEAIVPEDVAPFLIVLLVNASILLFTLVATYSVTPGRWHAMSLVTSALYLVGLFAFLNEWDVATVERIIH